MNQAETQCYGLNCAPFKRYVNVLTSTTCERDLIWKTVLGRYNQVKMRSRGWFALRTWDLIDLAGEAGINEAEEGREFQGLGTHENS